MVHETERGGIAEDYYQISEEILSSFSKFRLPLDLYVYNDKIKQLTLFSKKNSRLSSEQAEQLLALCAAENLFVSRADHNIYSQHIINQLDLVLVDSSLKDSEIADICIKALEMRLHDFFNQTIMPLFIPLHTDLLVVTEYLWNDKHKIQLFTQRLHTQEYSLPRHSINTCIIGLWLALLTAKREVSKKTFTTTALGLLLHDIGMSKIPSFIIEKQSSLKPEEYEKIRLHPMTGYKILTKLDLSNELLQQCALEHHERLDGLGYPQKRTEISSLGRLTAVADAFSAMIQKRAYAPAKQPLEAAKELTAANKQYDFAYTSAILGALAKNSLGKLT